MTAVDDRRGDLFSFDQPEPADAPAAPRRLPHVPALDGLRGMAVLAVVLYHFEVTAGGRWLAKGGFLGVDAFFVLSGYLITALLIAERRRDGAIDLRAFWARRARRLVPALVVVFLVFIGLTMFVYGPDLRTALRQQMTATLFYGANWYAIFSGESYVQQFSAPSPLRHMWSLAIEEQFYLVWPLVVVALLRRRRPRAVMWTALVMAVVSAVWMAAQFIPNQDPSRIYYGTDTRLQSLALGAALAAALAEGLTIGSDGARRGLGIVAVFVAAWLALAWNRTSYLADWLYTGGFLLLALSVCIIILACVDGPPPGIGNPVAAALSWRPLRFLGVISYGVYLFHWPIFLLITPDRTGLTGAVLTAARITATLALAVPSYLLIERPIRHGNVLQQVRWRPAFTPILGIALLMAIFASTTDAYCTLCPPERSDPPSVAVAPGAPKVPKVMLVGDSVAFSISFGFEGNPDTRNLVTLWNQAQYYCEFVQAARREANGKEIAHSIMCDDWKATWSRSKAQFKPDLIMLGIGPWEIFDRKVQGEWLVFGQPELDRVITDQLQQIIDVVTDDHTTLVLLTSPYLERQPVGESPPEWAPEETWRIDHLNALMRTVAAANPTRVRVIEYGAYLCPDGKTCTQSIDGVVLRPDGIHYEKPGASKVAPWIARSLHEIVDPAAAPPGTAPGGTSPGTAPVTPGTAP